MKFYILIIFKKSY